MQDLQSERNISSKGFDASVSSSSGNQSEPEHAENGKGKGKKSCLQLKQLHFTIADVSSFFYSFAARKWISVGNSSLLLLQICGNGVVI